MVIFVNENLEIKDVNETIDETLTPFEITEANPFEGWSVAKICCYRAQVKDGRVVMMTPYVDSRLIEHIDKLGNGVQTNTQTISETQTGLMEAYEETLNNSTSIEDCNNALMELYELVTNKEEV